MARPLALLPGDLVGVPPELLAELSRGARALAAELACGPRITKTDSRAYVDRRLVEIQRSRSSQSVCKEMK